MDHLPTERFVIFNYFLRMTAHVISSPCAFSVREMRHVTSGDGNYEHLWLTTNETNSLVFLVKSCGEAKIMLSHEVDDKVDAFEVDIGSYNNRRTAIARLASGKWSLNRHLLYYLSPSFPSQVCATLLRVLTLLEFSVVITFGHFGCHGMPGRLRLDVEWTWVPIESSDML